MLTVVTGNPGNGKSLWTTTTVEAMRLKDKREVYYDGIPDLVYPWHKLPMLEGGGVDWANVPDSSIVVIDEAWRVFPIRKQGSAVPDYVQFLATHRHHGLDIFLATQQVKTQLDTFVRGLAGKHVHLDRKFGMSYSMRYEWEGIADPSSTKSLAIAQNSRWVFPTSAYGTYKSAVEHTHKVKLPWKRMLTLGAGLVVVIAGVWFAFSVLRPKPKPVVVDSSGRSVKGEVVNKSVSGSDYWVKDRQVRITGVPASAALYDPLQKVRTQPRPEGCMRLDVGQAVRCTCTGPNSSELAIPVPQCLDLVKRGWFDETTRYEDAKVANIAQLNAGARGVVTNAKDGEPKAQEAE